MLLVYVHRLEYSTASLLSDIVEVRLITKKSHCRLRLPSAFQNGSAYMTHPAAEDQRSAMPVSWLTLFSVISNGKHSHGPPNHRFVLVSFFRQGYRRLEYGGPDLFSEFSHRCDPARWRVYAVQPMERNIRTWRTYIRDLRWYWNQCSSYPIPLDFTAVRRAPEVSLLGNSLFLAISFTSIRFNGWCVILFDNFPCIDGTFHRWFGGDRQFDKMTLHYCMRASHTMVWLWPAAAWAVGKRIFCWCIFFVGSCTLGWRFSHLVEFWSYG